MRHGHMHPQPPAWLDWVFRHPPFFILLFVATFALILRVLGIISGWAILSKRFRFTGMFYGQSWPFRSAQMRFQVQYGTCLSVGANESGLYLAIFPVFRIGHPPLLIPWSEVSVITGEKGIIFKKREFWLGRQESIPLRISASLAATLQRWAGNAWPVETIAV